MSWKDRSMGFLREVRIEFHKTTWPSREELWESTLVVLATVAIIGVFIFAVDQVVSRIITIVL